VKVRYCDGGSFTGDGSNAVSEILSQILKFVILSFTEYQICALRILIQQSNVAFFLLRNHNNSLSVFSFLCFRLQAFISEVSAFGRLLWMT
jgi:hypothetical protein